MIETRDLPVRAETPAVNPPIKEVSKIRRYGLFFLIINNEIR